MKIKFPIKKNHQIQGKKRSREKKFSPSNTLITFILFHCKKNISKKNFAG
jgi:hypothetical protein